MQTKSVLLLTSVCGALLLTGACTKCPTQTHMPHGYHDQPHKGAPHKKHGEPMVFQQNYTGDDVKKVKATMSTRGANGGESEMGTIWFKETKDGLKMNVDLIYLRPNKTYTAEVYQCGACNDNTCCAVEAMSVDLPQLKINNDGERLQQSYIVRGLTATQLNNAKIILTRDGGYKAAWGVLKQ